jgi:uncharacterized repeat protein (TIGR03803 family)
MAELVDALVSGTSGGNTVGVRVPFWALLCLALAGCSRSIGALPEQLSAQRAAPAAGAYRLLYSFAGYPSGSAPTGLAALGGRLYGTTINGGTKTFGTVFVSSVSGRVRILHSFRGGADGSGPQGTLVVLDGALYGTTEYGGSKGNGTVFEITPSGTERVIYSFKGGSDGATPVLVGMVVHAGQLYGTTNAGGNPRCHVEGIVGCGTVFALTKSGKERVLYRFNGKRDGACPAGALIDVNGTLYGTTNFGGIGNNGTVFKISSAGRERVVYAFKGYPDGAVPYAGVTALGGAFYGTTAFGGAFNYSGTVFRLSASGSEQILHSFKGYPDGALPFGSLTIVNGMLYGTTEYGGSSSVGCASGGTTGCGTLFSVTISGTERVLYRFNGEPDGASPWAGLTSNNGALYGTTLSGGASDAGSIFRYSTSSQ